MGIYDEKKFAFPGLKLDPSKKYVQVIAIAIALIVLLVVVSTASNFLKPDPFKLMFSNNPLDLSKEYNSMLKVKISNVTGERAENVIVRVSPEDNVSLLVFPTEQEIPVLEKGGERELLFTIRPDPRIDILQGAYKIKVSTVLNGEEYSKSAKVYIRTV